MIFDQYPIFWHIFYDYIRTTRPNLIIFTPIDRSFNYATFGIYKVKKFKNFLMGHFKTKKKNFVQGSNLVNPTGNPRKQFFWKAIFWMSLFQKKKLDWMNKWKVIKIWKTRHPLAYKIPHIFAKKNKKNSDTNVFLFNF